MTGNCKQGLDAVLVKRLASYTLSITIACAPGETVVLTGPSGSGKTTVLRCIAGLEPLDGGYIHFQGACWNNAATGLKATPQARGIGLLSQDYALFPHMTLARNITFAMPRAQDPDELLESMGIGHLRDKRPHEISGGERQRAALCQILAHCPRMLLLDEPFSALDIENRYLLRQKLQEVQSERNIPIIQVTHDLAEAFTLSPNILSLREGREDRDWLHQQKKRFIKDLQGFHRAPDQEALQV
jgi:molybdate transport system ATP-binding protein